MKLCFAFLFCFAALLPGGELPDREALFALPGWAPAPGYESSGNENIRGIFYDGLPYRGKPTRVFAWYGVPAKAEGKLPAIILVHGGGGTAFRYWARLWMERGYAVLAMDTTGGVPRNNGESGSDGSVRHPDGGPGLDRVFRDTGLPPQEQWPYHAIGAVIRANTLLRSFPEIDPERIGVTGISWGAVIGETAVSLDSRFKFAAMVYGCGFLGRNSSWKETEFAKMPPELVERWLQLWDPSSYRRKTRYRSSSATEFRTGTSGPIPGGAPAVWSSRNSATPRSGWAWGTRIRRAETRRRWPPSPTRRSGAESRFLASSRRRRKA